ALCAAVPDADVLGVFAGVPPGSLLGHRGLTHSLAFAAALAAILTPLLVPPGTRRRLWVYLFLATASHGVLDGMTNGGVGIAYFAPFDPSRHHLPWRPIAVSPLGLRRFLTPRALTPLANESLYLWLPSAAFALTAWLMTRRRPSANEHDAGRT